MALNLFHLTLIFYLNRVKSTALLPGLLRQFPTVSESRLDPLRRAISHVRNGHRDHIRWFIYERLLWDIPEIFRAKDGERICSSNKG